MQENDRNRRFEPEHNDAHDDAVSLDFGPREEREEEVFTVRAEADEPPAEAAQSEDTQEAEQKDRLVFQAMPDLTEQEAYQQLQQQNRRRLIGAGVVTLAVAGLFAAISSGGGEEEGKAASAPTLSQTTAVSAPTLTAVSEPAATALTASIPASAIATVPVLDDTAASVASAEPDLAAVEPVTEPAPAVSGNNVQNDARQAQEAAAKAAAQRLAREQQAAANAARAKAAAAEKRRAEQARVQQAQREQAKAEAPRETAKPAPAAPAGKGRVMVQAGAFKTPAQAQKVQKQLQGMGLNARISEVKTDKGTFLRVQAGPFADRSAAEAAAAKMKSSGLGGMVIGK